MNTTNYKRGGIAILFGVASVVFAQNKVPPQQGPASSAVSEKPQLSEPSKKAANRKKLPVIGYLEGRGKLIIIKSGPKGPVYSVARNDGSLLLEDLSVEQLRAQAPEIHEFIKSAMAVNTRGPRPTSDASLRIP